MGSSVDSKFASLKAVDIYIFFYIYLSFYIIVLPCALETLCGHAMLWKSYRLNIWVYFILIMSLERHYSVYWQMGDHKQPFYAIKGWGIWQQGRTFIEI